MGKFWGALNHRYPNGRFYLFWAAGLFFKHTVITRDNPGFLNVGVLSGSVRADLGCFLGIIWYSKKDGSETNLYFCFAFWLSEPDNSISPNGNVYIIIQMELSWVLSFRAWPSPPSRATFRVFAEDGHVTISGDDEPSAG